MGGGGGGGEHICHCPHPYLPRAYSFLRCHENVSETHREEFTTVGSKSQIDGLYLVDGLKQAQNIACFITYTNWRGMPVPVFSLGTKLAHRFLKLRLLIPPLNFKKFLGRILLPDPLYSLIPLALEPVRSLQDLPPPPPFSNWWIHFPPPLTSILVNYFAYSHKKTRTQQHKYWLLLWYLS